MLVARTFDDARMPAWSSRLAGIRRRLARHPARSAAPVVTPRDDE
ncbi:hypothetical protein [Catenuloplanes indicus]|uniref:Uncharacterized protein n=1 Tax=Catenuloplanes indicus TaxID=137267 RepID=A0AAE3VXK8_9ACTN|nr:hypothetical protein [Catenuloplanes indicus]MDQ0365152.1 hypothetical protein [Catenuloplanes indicus]